MWSIGLPDCLITSFSGLGVVVHWKRFDQPVFSGLGLLYIGSDLINQFSLVLGCCTLEVDLITQFSLGLAVDLITQFSLGLVWRTYQKVRLHLCGCLPLFFDAMKVLVNAAYFRIDVCPSVFRRVRVFGYLCRDVSRHPFMDCLLEFVHPGCSSTLGVDCGEAWC